MTRLLNVALILALPLQGCGSDSSNRPGAASAGAAGGGNAGTSATTGGTGGAGTSAGTGGQLPAGGNAQGPHTVSPCPMMDDGVVGKWENVTPGVPPSDYKGAIFAVSVAVSPQDPSIVYTSLSKDVAGQAFGMFKSTDCGATWTKANTGRNGAALDSGSQWGIVVDPVDSNVIYVSNGYGSPPSLFKSTDGGTNWDQVFMEDSEVAKVVEYNFTQGVAMDPANPKHLAVTFHANCKEPYAPMCLAETTDAGATWRLFKGPLGGWGEGAGPILLGGSKLLYAGPFNGMFYTEDGGANWEKVADDAYANAYHSPNGTWFIGTNNGILSGTDGKKWTKVEGAPRTVGLVGDGVTLFATFQNDETGQPMYSAPEDKPTTWTKLESPTIKQGGSGMAYDPDHHIVYSSNYSAGLWRMITRKGPPDNAGAGAAGAGGSP